jgi:hypothetical protein
MIPEPTSDGRLLLALDDCINPKTGKEIFGCDRVFDHAAKLNQSKYPWAQNIVVVGLLKTIKGRWACLPLSYRFYHLKKSMEKVNQVIRGPKVEFQTKIEQAVEMITEISKVFDQDRIIAVTDSWFGNDGLWKPLSTLLGTRFHMISRLRANNNVFNLPEPRPETGPGRPRKYGRKLGNTSVLANWLKPFGKQYSVNLYGRKRTVVACDQVVMLKTLKCAVRVVFIYRRTQWVALYSTDLTLGVTKIIEYYGARWKIESAFKELKQDIGSAESQTRHPNAVSNHLHFCMMAASVAWIYASRMEKTPSRRHAVNGRNHFAFSDVRRSVAKVALDKNFRMLCGESRISLYNSIVTALMRLAA